MADWDYQTGASLIRTAHSNGMPFFNILIYATTDTGALLDLIPAMAATTPTNRTLSVNVTVLCTRIDTSPSPPLIGLKVAFHGKCLGPRKLPLTFLVVLCLEHSRPRHQSVGPGLDHLIGSRGSRRVTCSDHTHVVSLLGCDISSRTLSSTTLTPFPAHLVGVRGRHTTVHFDPGVHSLQEKKTGGGAQLVQCSMMVRLPWRQSQVSVLSTLTSKSNLISTHKLTKTYT